MNTAYTSLEQHLLNDFQRDLPLSPRPFAVLAEQLGVTEEEVVEGLEHLQQRGAVSRVGPVFRANRVGVSTLAAMSVPGSELPQVAETVNTFAEVNHNYEREHHFNLWFVATAPDAARLAVVLREIEAGTGYPVMDLPMLDDYFIDLGFDLRWEK